MYKSIIIILLLLVIFFISVKTENLVSPGYTNRLNVNVDLDKTYGGTDKYFSKDPRFGI